MQIALGKCLANALDSRAWINEPKEAIKSLSKDAQDLLERIQGKYADNQSKLDTISSQKLDNGKNGIMSQQKPNGDTNMQSTNISISTHDTYTITHLRSEASKIIDGLLGKNITNKNDGRVAQISKNGRNKILSGAALRKSNENGFSKEEHFKASENIKELYENGFLIKSEPARNNSNDIKEVHRYVSNLQINNKEAQALLTIKEIVEHGNKIYSLELQELRPIPKG